MGTDDIFKKRRKAREKRKYGYKQPKANSFLIVTEGKCTEPFYFKGIQEAICEKTGGRIDVVEVPVIDVFGEGCSTVTLIDRADEIVNKANILYQNIWIVFDKDDFKDFDFAVNLGKARGYKVAWSNQSFEYWLYLHFNYSESALHREQWNEKLNAMFEKYQLGNGKYQKNYKNIYSLLDNFGGVETAIKHAKRRMRDFDEKECKPSEYDPGTTVYQLVEDLRKYLKTTNAAITGHSYSK